MANVRSIDPIKLAVDLIRCESVTPREGGALTVLEDALSGFGLTCYRLPFQADGTERVDNLYARIGTKQPHFCFAGHTDVVPEGERADWAVDPFAAEIVGTTLIGRGATDMKGAISAFVAALADFLNERGEALPGSISLLITGDEEGSAINGTKKVLEWMAEKGERIDDCLVGEPTNPNALGEMIKIGRRGSVSAWLTVSGTQGHVAYPNLANNPIPRLIAMLRAVTAEPLDEGAEHFQPSNLEVTSIDVGNPVTNVIPAHARAALNIRFNTLHTSESLIAWLHKSFDAVGGDYELKTHVTGEAFLTPPGSFSRLLSSAVQETLGREPTLSTTGGTSDARFIKDYCPVAEFGLISRTMHKVDEQADIGDIVALKRIYKTVLDRYFAA